MKIAWHKQSWSGARLKAHRARDKKRKLSKKEMGHFEEWCGTIEGLENNLAKGSKKFPCEICKKIARKLGIGDAKP